MNQATLFTGQLETREDALRLVDQWVYATDWKTLEDRRNQLAELILEVDRRAKERG